MSYNSIAKAAHDQELKMRITACIATQSGYVLPNNVFDAPTFIAEYYLWRICAQPGWGEAYQYALDTSIENPGGNEAVITDGMIISAVQLVLGIS